MVKKVFFIFLAIICPFIALLIRDEPGKSFVAIMLQATIVLWPFASFWAIKVILHPEEYEEDEDEEEA